MIQRLTAFFAFAGLALQPALSLAASPAAKPELDRQVECAMVFALVAGMQDNKAPASERYPAMDEPGRVFFSRTLVRIQAERGLSQDDAMDYLLDEGGKLITKMAISADLMAAVDEQMESCMPLFETVAPEAAPKARD